MAADKTHEYQVYVDDNFHYMDEGERYSGGVFEDCETAKAKCRGIVDEFLSANYKQSMTPDELLRLYKSYGEDPWIFSGDGNCRFSAWDYAAEQCEEICGGD